MASGWLDIRDLRFNLGSRNHKAMMEVQSDPVEATSYRILLIEGYNNVIEQLTPFGPSFRALEQAEAYYDEHELWRGAYGSNEDNREYRIVEVRAREEGRIYFADGQIPWQTGNPVTLDRDPDGETLRIWTEDGAFHWEAAEPTVWN